jgi:hypothetical protein
MKMTNQTNQTASAPTTAAKSLTIRGCRMMKKGIKSPAGKYTPVWYSHATLLGGIDAITIYAKSLLKPIPCELGEVQNDSDGMSDYFESDKIRFCAGSPEFAALLPFAV